LIAMIDARFGASKQDRRMHLPLSAGEALAWLRARMEVLDMRQDDSGFWLVLRGDPEDFGRFEKRFSGVAEVEAQAPTPEVDAPISAPWEP
jgi:hypothetical protein